MTAAGDGAETAAVVVPDASVLAAVAFGEPRREEAAALPRGRRLVAPDLLPYELAGVARKKVAVDPSASDAVRVALAGALELPVTLVSPDQTAVLELALRLGLSTYDAAHAWLARSLGVPLMTLDRTLREAADRP
ncbi:MAG: type II toxin-antitoxin system VapC family toxin [Thermoleophilia bacterium]